MRVATDGPITPSEVWRRYEHIDLWPLWAPQITKIIRDGEKLAPGVSGQVVGPAGVRVNFEILAVDPERMEWTWRVERGPFAVQLIHGVEAFEQGSRAWIEINPLLFAYAPFAWYALHRLVTLPDV